MNINVTSRRINTIVVAQNEVRRRQIMHSISGESGLNIVDNVPYIHEIGKNDSSDSVDVVVLEVSDNNSETLSTICRIREMASPPNVVAVSDSADSSLIRNVLGSGAIGYVLQDAEDEHLGKAIESAISNDVYLCPEVTGLIVKSFLSLTRFEHDCDDDYQSLSARESRCSRCSQMARKSKI